MDVYTTEEEQIEALRRWWKQNGRSVLMLLVLVLLAVFGWRTWMGYETSRAEAASVQYERLMGLLETEPAKAVEVGQELVGQYPSSTYAALASLSLARVAVEGGDLEQAEAHLRRVAESAKPPELRALAQLRLARVLLAQGQLDEAQKLAETESAGYRAAFDELRGDIYLARGERGKARAAYTNALAGYDVPSKQSIVQMKLNDLADAKEKQS